MAGNKEVQKKPAARAAPDGDEADGKAKKQKIASEEQAQLTKDRKDMFGYLKFIGAKDTPEMQAKKKQALATYNSLVPCKRTAFVQRWAATADRKGLTWVKDYEETTVKEKEAQRTTTTGVYTRTPYQCARTYFF